MAAQNSQPRLRGSERQLTSGPGGRILTNAGVWSPDSRWIVYDTRPDTAGEVFGGTRIEKVNVETGEVRLVYESSQGACCGVASYNQVAQQIAFIHGPENATPDWTYGPAHRRGVIVDDNSPGVATTIDACVLTPPFPPGALRGGSHVHIFSPDGQWLSFTYQDALLAGFQEETAEQDIDLRNVGVAVSQRPVRVNKNHPRNHDGSHFCVLVTRTIGNPRPGSDEIKKAFEEGWVGKEGYVRADGTRQKRALAFQGHVVTKSGATISEVFVVDLPEDLTVAGAGPLAGTERRRPFPPRGVEQRRLTFTAERKYPGLQGPRHWLRSSPDGARIAFLMKDDSGVVQLWTVSPQGGSPTQLTRNHWDIASAFTWNPDGRAIAHVMDNSLAMTDTLTGVTTRLTTGSANSQAPRPEACVFSPNGRHIAYVRNLDGRNQIFIFSLLA